MGIADRFLDQKRTDSSKDDAVAFATETADAVNGQRSLLDVAWESCKYQMLQAPAHGVGQLIDRGFGTSFQKDWTFMEAPKQAHSTGEWHAQQIGGAVGMLAPFAAINLGVRTGATRLLGAGESIGAVSMRQAIMDSALSGAIYEGVFTPSADNESIGFGRFKNAVHGATTFGIMTGTAKGLFESGLIRNRIGVGIASGLPAGAWSTQMESLMHGRGPASMEETGKGMYGFALAGGFLSALHSIPMGEKAPTKAEYTIANEQSRAALEAVRSGEKTTAWADVLKGKEIKRLFVGHEGENLDALPGARPDLVALCQMPSMSAWASRLALRGATERPIFMDLSADGSKVRFSLDRMSAEAVSLGAKENVRDLTRIMDENGMNPEDSPSWLGQFKPTGKSWRGNNSLVIELASKEGRPEVVLKVKEADMEPSRWFEADIYDAQGRLDNRAVFETEDKHNGSPLYMFLESKHEFNPRDWTGYEEFMEKLEAEGIQLEPGSGPPVGKDVNTGRWSVTDRDATSSFGSGVHDVERAAAMGRDGYEAYIEAEEAKSAEAESWDKQEGMGTVDMLDMADAKGQVATMKLSAEEAKAGTPLFPHGDMVKQIRSLLAQMTDGMSSREDVEVMQTWTVNEGNAKLSKQQIAFAKEVARARKLKTNF